MFYVEFIRRERKWSQVLLGKRSGLRQAIISGIETGRYNPDAQQLESLGQALGVAPGRLMQRVVGSLDLHDERASA